ncbi:mechanosensitive ion channel family protein [Clostridium tyrobutyricum]|uniref:mechanosensitive ion channel family protein n=1 Tax=Clostridium tyrobutyricum TaxID=1519 RepID=UPI001C37FF91|nr:mechanosensitive ion channel domain-containing protein [Clostridium tyrobutyricum]MBV4420021.1 mechanosensitive ion channel family protein [Clostridium tyrobutyricum]
MKEKLLSIFKITTYNGGITIGKFPISEEKIYSIISGFIKIILILIIMYISIKIGNMIINRYIKKQKYFKFSLDDRKVKTVGAILKSVLKYCVYFFGVFGIISIIMPKVGATGLTFAGIGGVAVGFGAQSIIKDVINGFFILFEDQFSVGEYVDIGDKSGIVESLELRITKIRDLNGDLHIIPNGIITETTNHSRGSSKILVDIDISYEEDSDNVISKMSDLCKKFGTDNEEITDGPSVLGITKIKDGVVTIRIIGRTKPMQQWKIEVKLRDEIIKALKKDNIKLPYKEVKITRGK